MLRKRYLVPALTVVGALVLSAGVLAAGAGSGAPSGSHYNLNLIGVDKGKSITNGSGNVIFVPLSGRCTINLSQGSFNVLDKNCTDDNQAGFQLPNPDPTNSGTSAYSVYVAARGKPLGSATANACYTDTTGQYCSAEVLNLSRNFGANKFSNVTKDLLYVYACISGTIQRVPLFSDQTAAYYWTYDNSGLRNAALRFYPGVQTTVPSGGGGC
jgi:hypothetical protein